MERETRLIAVFFLFLSGFAVVFSLLFFPVSQSGVPGPRLFPLGVGLVIFVAALLLLIKPGGTGGSDLPSLKSFFYLALLIVFYALCVVFIGFVVSSTLFIFVMVKRYAGYKWQKASLIALLTAGMVFLVFEFLLDVPLEFGFLI